MRTIDSREVSNTSLRSGKWLAGPRLPDVPTSPDVPTRPDSPCARLGRPAMARRPPKPLIFLNAGRAGTAGARSTALGRRGENHMSSEPEVVSLYARAV